MRTLLALSLAALALACAGSPSAPSSAAGPPGGERLYRSKCTACHRAYPPSSRDATAWAQVLSKMAPRAKLSEPEREQILGFLQSNAKDAPAGAHP